MVRFGERVLVKTRKGEKEGLLIPSPREDVLILKLDNGYNLGLEKKEVLEIKRVKKEEKEEKVVKKTIQKTREINREFEKKTEEKNNLPLVSLLHCGGTIASKVDYETGAVKAKFSPQEILEMFPELKKIVRLRSYLVANLMSENMRFAHYNLIGKAIKKEVSQGVEGIIVTQGTDTLHYTAAALAFLLEDLGLPVLLVGAQRSSDRGSSDAFLNLKSAACFIARSDFGGVAICMHQLAEDKGCLILPPTKARKMHTSRRDAFKVINGKPYAIVSSEGKITWLNKNYPRKDKRKKLKLKLFKEDLKIGLIKAHPQMFAEELKPFEKFDGLVLEGTGLGHFPIIVSDPLTKEHSLILKKLQTLAKKKPLVMTSQALFGRINLNVYSPGRKLKEINILGNLSDLTTETAFIKLAWLLSNFDKGKIKQLWSKNFRGELEKRSEYQPAFLF